MPAQPQAFTSQKNKYAGKCRTCDNSLELDKPVHCIPVHDGTWRRYHVDCTPDKVEARLMSLVKLTHDIIERKSCDEWTERAIVNADSTDTEINQALSLYSRSGYPAPLRSYTYRMLTRESPTSALVTVYEFLHD